MRSATVTNASVATPTTAAAKSDQSAANSNTTLTFYSAPSRTKTRIKSILASEQSHLCTRRQGGSIVNREVSHRSPKELNLSQEADQSQPKHKRTHPRMKKMHFQKRLKRHSLSEKLLACRVKSTTWNRKTSKTSSNLTQWRESLIVSWKPTKT